MFLELFKLIIEHPSGSTLILVGVCAVFYLGSVYSTMRALQSKLGQLVTKDDLELAMAKFRESLGDAFVTTRHCEEVHKVTTVPIAEHAALMARVAVLERESDKNR